MTHPNLPATCKTCHTPLIRRANESTTKFRRRIYCSRDCQNESRRLKEPRLRTTCKYCESPLIRRPNESNRNFQRRQYCSPECHNESRRGRTAKPACGTHQGYWWHNKHNSPVCDACRAAFSKYRKERKAERRAEREKEQLRRARIAAAKKGQLRNRRDLKKKFTIDGYLLVQLVDACADKNTLDVLDMVYGADTINALLEARDNLTEREPMNDIIGTTVTVAGREGTWKVQRVVNNFVGLVRDGKRLASEGEGTSEIDLAVTRDQLTPA